MSEHADVEAKTVSRGLIVLLGALSAFAPLSIDMYLPGLPSIQRHFDAPAWEAQATLTACLIGLAGAQLFIGPLSDRIGRRRPLLIGVGVYSIVSLVCAASGSLPLLIVLRLVQGAAGAAGIVIARAVVRDLRSGAAAARLFAMLVAVNGLAPALAPVIGAQLLSLGGWRLTFVALAVVGVLLFASAVIGFPETRQPVEGAAKGELQRTIYARLLRDRRFVIYALVSGFVMGALFIYISGSPFVLEGRYGVSPAGFSGIFAMNAAFLVLGSQIGARTVERLGARRLLVIGVGECALGAAVLVVGQIFGLGLFGIILGLLFVVGSVGVVNPNAQALAMADYRAVAGSASGLLGVGQFVIGATLAPLVGAIGVSSATPMVAMIGGFSIASLTLTGTLLAGDRSRQLHSPVGRVAQ